MNLSSSWSRLLLRSPWVPALVSALALSACAGNRPAPEAGVISKPAAPLGITQLVFDDDDRGRTLVAEVFYPAVVGSEVETETHAVVFDVAVARDAKIVPSAKPRPLIVISHGSGGTHYDLNWLARPLVEAGFILVAPVHPGSTFGDRDPQKTLEVWERPRDLTVVLDRLLTDATWGPRVDAKRIGAMGYSLGGYSVLALAGARYDVSRARAHCLSADADPTCAYSADVDTSEINYGPSGGTFADSRIGAVLAFAPAIGAGIDPASLAGISIPISVVGSRQDALTTFDVHAQQWERNLREAGAPVALTVVEEADHYTYLPVCNGTGQFAAALSFAEACLDVTGADRDQVHRDLIPMGVEFFSSALTRD